MSTGANLVGTKLGSYAVESLIGRGGMSAVYRAFDSKLARPVAIKVLSATVANQPGFADRFRREARLLARLQHPRIVRVYDVGEHDGALYMVQELLPGPTLESRLAELARHGQRLSVEEVLAIVRDMAAALDAAHAAGIIHRDVKPANMICNGEGALVLTDFGIAEDTREAERYTSTGVILGTPTYLSPEQAQAQQLTPAVDIYSLGVVLYELLAGQPPFAGAIPLSVALSHVQSAPPPLRQRRPDLPQQVDLVVRRALAKAPSDRFASASALAEALELALSPASHPGVAPPLHSRHALTRPAAVVVALLLAGGGLAWHGRPGDRDARASMAARPWPIAAALPTAESVPAADPFSLPTASIPTPQPTATVVPPTSAPPTAPAAPQPPIAARQASAALPAAPALRAPAAKVAPKPKQEQPKAAPPQPKPTPKDDKPKGKSEPKPKDDKPKGKDKPEGGGKPGKGGGKKDK